MKLPTLPTLLNKCQYVTLYAKNEYFTRDTGEMLDIMHLAGGVFKDYVNPSEDDDPFYPLLGVPDERGVLLLFRIKTKTELESLTIYSVNAEDRTMDSVIMCEPFDKERSAPQLVEARKDLEMVPFGLFQDVISQTLSELMKVLFSLDDSLLLSVDGDSNWIAKDSGFAAIIQAAKARGVPDEIKDAFPSGDTTPTPPEEPS